MSLNTLRPTPNQPLNEPAMTERASNDHRLPFVRRNWLNNINLCTGPNNLTVFSSDDTVGDLEGKMLLHYNAKACGHAMCVDLSSNENNGRLVGQQCSTSDIKVKTVQCTRNICSKEQPLDPCCKVGFTSNMNQECPDVNWYPQMVSTKVCRKIFILQTKNITQWTTTFSLFTRYLCDTLTARMDSRSTLITLRMNSLWLVVIEFLQDVIHCIGGVQVLFPWLEYAGKLPIKSDKRISIAPSSGLQSDIYNNLQDDWVVVQSATYVGKDTDIVGQWEWSIFGWFKRSLNQSIGSFSTNPHFALFRPDRRSDTFGNVSNHWGMVTYTFFGTIFLGH